MDSLGNDHDMANQTFKQFASNYVEAFESYILEYLKEIQSQTMKSFCVYHEKNSERYSEEMFYIHKHLLNFESSKIIEIKRKSLLSKLNSKKESIKACLNENSSIDLSEQVDIEQLVECFRQKMKTYESQYSSSIRAAIEYYKKMTVCNEPESDIDSDQDEKYTDFNSDTEVLITRRFFDSKTNKFVKTLKEETRILIEKFERSNEEKNSCEANYLEQNERNACSETELGNTMWSKNSTFKQEILLVNAQLAKQRRELKGMARKTSKLSIQNANNNRSDNEKKINVEIDESFSQQSDDSFRIKRKLDRSDVEDSSKTQDREYIVLSSSDSSADSDKEFENRKIKLKIHCGMKVLALQDPVRHLWRIATINRIKTFNNDINYAQNRLKLSSNAKYIVQFERSKESQTTENVIQEYESNPVNKEITKQYSPEKEDDDDSEDICILSSVSSSSDNGSVLEADVKDGTYYTEADLNRKRKLKLKKKKRKIKKSKRNQIELLNSELVEMDATSIAFLQTGSDLERLPDLPYIDFDKKINTLILPIRSRVVSHYNVQINDALDHKKKLLENKYMCSATIMELPAIRNGHRYLVLFDNGYISYVHPRNVHPIFDLFKSPIERLDFDHVHFIKSYFEIFPDRAMVRLEKNAVVNLFINNKWHDCKVIEVDASLVKLELNIKMFIEQSSKTTLSDHNIWFYRGSCKLYSVYEMITNKINESNEDPNVSLNSFEKYLKEKQKGMICTQNRLLSLFASTAFPNIGRRPQSRLKSNKDDQQQRIIQGQIKLLDLETSMRNEIFNFRNHPCANYCVSKWENNIEIVKSVNPLLMPCIHGWQRHICQQTKTINTGSKKWVNYMSPCGRILRSTSEVERYLFLTNSKLTIDMFSFDYYIHTNREYEANAKYLKIDDITDGKESVPISCVNCIDTKKPEIIEYSSKRIALKGVPLDTNINLMEGCQCEDNCRDRSKCACWRKTFESTTLTFENQMNTNVGYRGRHLPEMVNTGIFECNSLCKCDHRCSNRVVQNGISLRLQLFKTQNKGWGLRCLDDIPKGQFICTYTGHLITEEESDIRAIETGDEYFAELDFVECLKKLKEGFNLLSNEFILGKEEFDMDESNSSIPIVLKKFTVAHNSFQPTTFYRKNTISVTDNSQENGIIFLESDEDEQDHNEIFNSENNAKAEKSFNKREEKDEKIASSIGLNAFFTNPNSRFFYENYFENSKIFIMDAKLCGNIGRFFNHSCSPNIYVQNVFVDTYDLRFPWVCFFSIDAIKAGTELCWDYNYTIGSVKGKELYCHCNSANCRGRLL